MVAIKVLIADDHQLIIDGIKSLLCGEKNIEIVGEAKDGKQAIEFLKNERVDVILMDIDMPGVNGIEGLKRVREMNQQVKVLMLTVFDDNKNVFEALKNGANGYLLKKTPPAKLLEYIGDVASGGAPMTSSIATQVLKMFSEIPQQANNEYNLSEREKQVLQLLVNGYSYKMIANDMFIAIDTVRSHIKKIYEKLQVNSKSEAVAKAFKDKII